MRKVTGFLVGYLCLTLVILFSPADAHCQSCQQPPPHCGAAIMQSAPRTLMSPTPGLCGTYMAMPTMCPSTNQNQNIHLDVCVDGLNKAISCPASQVTPDTNVAVADDMSGEVVEFVNDAYLVLDKSGHLLAGPFSDGSLFPSQGNGGQGCYIGGNDVTVQWDKFNRRWLLSFKANTSPPMQLKRLICVAVSTTPDAAGSYYTYEYDMTPTGLATDYPQWGIWPTGYFQTLNGQTGSVSAVCAYDSTSLVNGGTAQQICVPLYFSAGQPNCSDTYLLPGDVDSTVKPPAGQDEFFVGSAGQGQADNGECYNGNGNCTNLYLYSMHPDWNNYGNTVVQGCGLSNPIPVQPYELFCPGLSGCVPQNSGVSLEALGRYSMRRFAYWNDQSGIFSKQHWFGNHVRISSTLKQSYNLECESPAVRYIHAGWKLPLDGIDRAGQFRRHRVGIQRVKHQHRSLDLFDRPNARRHDWHDGARG